MFMFYIIFAPFFLKGEHNVLNINTIKQPQYKILETPGVDNNKRKFAFLSTETVPDYRPKEQRIEKSQKTSSNQTTKFQQLQQKFELNNRNSTYKEINGIDNDIALDNDVSNFIYYIKDNQNKYKQNFASQCHQGGPINWVEEADQYRLSNL